MMHKTTPRSAIYRLLTFLWIGLIFAFSLQDGLTSTRSSGWITQTLQTALAYVNVYLEPTTLSWWVRKAAHFFEYFVLGSLALKSAPLFNRYALYPLVFIIPILDELLQSFVPGRAGTLEDVLIDALGLISAYLLMRGLSQLNKDPVT